MPLAFIYKTSNITRWNRLDKKQQRFQSTWDKLQATIYPTANGKKKRKEKETKRRKEKYVVTGEKARNSLNTDK